MKQYAPWIIGAVVVIGGVGFLATSGSNSTNDNAEVDDAEDRAFVPARVVDEREPSSGEDAVPEGAATGKEGGQKAKAGVANAGSKNSAGGGGGGDAELPLTRLFEGRVGAANTDEKTAGGDAPPAVLPSQREISPAQKAVRDTFVEQTQKKTMECIAGFVGSGKSFKGDVVLRVKVKHDAGAKEFTYDMDAIELAGTTNGRLSDFDDKTYRCLWDGIGSVKAPETASVDDAFFGDDTLAIDVPYAIEVRGEEKP